MVLMPTPPYGSDLCYVEVAVFSPLPGSFTYLWPAALGEPEAGLRLVLPFGKGRRYGVLLNRVSPEAVAGQAGELRAVEDRLDLTPPYDAGRCRWLERLRRYYLAPPGEVWSTALAWAAQDEKRRFRCPDVEALVHRYPMLADVFLTRAALSLSAIIRRAQAPYVWYAVLCANEQGLLQEEACPSEPAVEAPLSEPLQLTGAQRQAVAALAEGQGSFSPNLLFGCTGSGKTEVYLQAAASIVAEGGQLLVLVPEIGLTPLWIERLKRRFLRVAVWHSAMSGRERLETRQRLDEIEVLIGTRSALFLPLPRLQMIVIDEEHDASFKQQEGMAYSARDAALLLAQELNIPIVLGSATPSLESWRQAAEGSYRRLDLPERIARQSTPMRAEIVDMRGADGPVSSPLLAALCQTKESGEQAILFLNRRGYAPALQCTACGEVPECPSWSMRLTLHRRAGQLRCHACGFRRRTPSSCEACGEAAFMPLGEGTEKLEDILQETLPELRLARFDRDVITSHERLTSTLADFEAGKTDCLVGTQMLVKGHDFPNVTLVGVINADLGVNLPDFRAGERWWQQLTQVTGRAGRGDKPGRVIIQTRMPEAPWLSRLSEAEAEATLGEELELRRQLGFPPYARWVRVLFSATKAERARQTAEEFAGHCAGLEGVAVSDAMPCAIERLAGRFRYEVLLRDSSRRILPWKLEPLLAALPLASGVRRRVDVDPQDMM